jgi:hypothetical protein
MCRCPPTDGGRLMDFYREYREYIYVGVGGMKDYKVKLMDLHVSDTLGSVGNWNT